ncbi:MAG: DUF4136 domain-containing protein [Sulfurimonas sp.]|nr:DUF4136 domain-containing protein [Campylobacteraceae bacterium]MCF6339460.1 DUF4136 domain-containing protein [Sulfurimonas sp.]
MKKWFTAAFIGMLIGGCSTLQVQVDHDPEYNFSSLSKFKVIYTKKGDEKDFTRSRISKSLDKYMQNKGYISVAKSKADFYITMHLDIQTKSQVETNYETMGIGPVSYPYVGLNRSINNNSVSLLIEPDMRVTTRTYEYEEGRVIFEVFDAKENIVIWQGIAKDHLSSEHTQEQKSAYINSVIDKLFKDFPDRK